MSFKREGNDSGLLGNLRRRRIKELFVEDIPEDEAKLLCNGRFACLVCSHNPVFDTVNMLAVHRQGKKHVACEVGFVRKKKELRSLILKRKHEQYVKDGTTNIRQAASTSSGGLNSSQPYDPRAKKLKQYDRKPCLDLLQPETHSQSSSSASSASSNAFSETIPSRHSHQLKNIFRRGQKQAIPVQPYVSHRKTVSRNVSLSPADSNLHQLSLSSDKRSASVLCNDSHSYAPLPSTSQSPHDSGKEASTSKASNSCLLLSSVASLGSKRTGPPRLQKNNAQLYAAGKQTDVSGDQLDDCGRTGKCGDGVRCASSGSAAGLAGSCSSNTVGDPEKSKLVQKYHHLSGSGWKKDWDGKWIRDEEAEFDSDEEPPDLP